MGAEPWVCSVAYQPDILAALEAAQAQEFAAGRYTMKDENAPPTTIAEAREQAAESGTASVLDMIGVVETPHEIDAETPNYCTVAPLSPEQLQELYGTDKPTKAMVDGQVGFFEWIDRGLGVCIITYDGETPKEIVFAGYSFD